MVKKSSITIRFGKIFCLLLPLIFVISGTNNEHPFIHSGRLCTPVLDNSQEDSAPAAAYTEHRYYESTSGKTTIFYVAKAAWFLPVAGLLLMYLFVRIKRKNIFFPLRFEKKEKNSRERVLPRKVPVHEPLMPSEEEIFYEKLIALLEKNISDERFNVEMLAVEMNMSSRHLRRKIRQLTGESPVTILRQYRLERARKMLARNTGNISQIAYQCGFSDPGYFSRCFRDTYGKRPTDYKMACA